MARRVAARVPGRGQTQGQPHRSGDVRERYLRRGRRRPFARRRVRRGAAHQPVEVPDAPGAAQEPRRRRRQVAAQRRGDGDRRGRGGRAGVRGPDGRARNLAGVPARDRETRGDGAGDVPRGDHAVTRETARAFDFRGASDSC